MHNNAVTQDKYPWRDFCLFIYLFICAREKQIECTDEIERNSVICKCLKMNIRFTWNVWSEPQVKKNYILHLFIGLFHFFSFLWAVALWWGICSLTHWLVGGGWWGSFYWHDPGHYLPSFVRYSFTFFRRFTLIGDGLNYILSIIQMPL